jgi:hypothetical protein
VSIAAPPSAVWPWLVQIGQGRGGFYSYDWLENLAGLDIRSARTIEPQLQKLEVGDVLPASPEGGSGMAVAAFEPGEAIVFRPLLPWRMRASWAFVIARDRGVSSRLISRFRIGGTPRWLIAAGYTALVELPHFIMERKMLLGIKHRAEQRFRNPQALT